MDVQKISLKLYADNGEDISPESWRRALNAWIQREPKEVLVDVADYSHLHRGPVAVLAGHHASYAIDGSDGKLGLLYSRKQPLPGDFSGRLATAYRVLLEGCRRLERDSSIGHRVSFRADRSVLILNDRLLAPNAEDTYRAVLPHLDELLRTLYAGSPFTVSRDPDPKRRFTLEIAAQGEWKVADLLGNIRAFA
jgi:hypothetical protein